MCTAIGKRYNNVPVLIYHHGRNADAILAVLAILSVFAIVTDIAFIALLALRTGGSGVALVSFFSLFSGRFYSEGTPCLTIVIGNIPKVIVADF